MAKGISFHSLVSLMCRFFTRIFREFKGFFSWHSIGSSDVGLYKKLKNGQKLGLDNFDNGEIYKELFNAGKNNYFKSLKIAFKEGDVKIFSFLIHAGIEYKYNYIPVIQSVLPKKPSFWFMWFKSEKQLEIIRFCALYAKELSNSSFREKFSEQVSNSKKDTTKVFNLMEIVACASNAARDKPPVTWEGQTPVPNSETSGIFWNHCKPFESEHSLFSCS